MGVLLAILLLLNMFGALLLLPSMIAILKPKFLSRKT
jgi:predicted RND superfamily exporter protein